MQTYLRINLFLTITSGLLLFGSCQNMDKGSSAKSFDFPLPASDSLNEGGWVLNEELSDEFDGNKLDPKKWFVEGQNGEYYIWKGRAPSQFVPHNAIVEDGKLKLRTQWEPDYTFNKESYADGAHND